MVYSRLEDGRFLDHTRNVAEYCEHFRTRRLGDEIRCFLRGVDSDQVFHPGTRLLEVGCGRGNTMYDFEQNYGVVPTGLDLENTLGKGMYSARGIKPGFVVGNTLALPFQTGKFRTAFSYFAFPYIPDTLQALREIHK